MGSIGQWSALSQRCIDTQKNSLPAQWALPVDKLATKSSGHITSLPQTSGVLSDLELQMTEQDADSILRKYLLSDWTRLIGNLNRISDGKQLNFATEFLSNEALARADELDEYFARTGKLAGPLHGIPISIKEHLEVAGKITHAGFVSKISHVSDEDALIVKLLKDAGAVLHIRTNQPQSLMHLDCDNNITGRTLNPHNLRLTPGGSSGGEGASVGFRASVMGVGTDIGGSIRVPAAFNNCYGLRPTTLRNSNLGLYGINAGQESIRGVAGPLGQSLNDLELFQKALLDQHP
ncbi:fatty-acid amide hydrolase [Hortaea werneckii]|nr:fatty-acid amide hydrolase [Hortaea werneckii]